MRPNWELTNCCNHEQVVFLITVAVCTVIILALWRTVLLRPFKLVTVFLHEASHAIACKLTCGHISLQVEGIQVHADEGGTTQTRGGVYWLILPAGYLGSSFWGMLLILASTNLLTARIAAGCFIAALLIVLCIAKNTTCMPNIGFHLYPVVFVLLDDVQWMLRGLCIGFIVFLGIIWVLQETTTVRVLRYIILFIGVMNSLFSVYDIYDDLISRRVRSSDAEKFAEECPCCTGCGWGVIWGFISFGFLCGAMYLGLNKFTLAAFVQVTRCGKSIWLLRSSDTMMSVAGNGPWLPSPTSAI
ncbi:hypothetical protein C1H46_031447 [Malus baccata]|uniref:Uncharacterized protein n=1 Tax=Malus baccata TaxID=106549 RepID=A0A540L956_MALBA|nr:hypothetical protein C1H46_031447 [Malus baccata]